MEPRVVVTRNGVTLYDEPAGDGPVVLQFADDGRLWFPGGRAFHPPFRIEVTARAVATQTPPPPT